MAVVTLELGELGACCYLVSADGAATDKTPCVAIDPGAEPERVTAAARRAGLDIQAVLLTHAHADHIGGVDGVLADWPDAVLCCSEETGRRAADPRLNLSVFLGNPITSQSPGKVLADGESFEAGGLSWRAVEVPGHDPGEMVYVLADTTAAFTGDTVFAGSIGRSDFPDGDGAALVAGVKALLSSLPRDCVLYPGHGPATTAGDELAHNPFLR